MKMTILQMWFVINNIILYFNDTLLFSAESVKYLASLIYFDGLKIFIFSIAIINIASFIFTSKKYVLGTAAKIVGIVAGTTVTAINLIDGLTSLSSGNSSSTNTTSSGSNSTSSSGTLSSSEVTT